MAFTKASPSAAPLGIQSLCGRCVTFLSRKTDTSEIAFAAQQTGGEVLRPKYGACREGWQKMRFAFSRFVQTPTRAEPCAPCSRCPEKDTMGSGEGGRRPPIPWRGETHRTVNSGRGPSWPILGAGRSEAPNVGWIVPSGLEARGAGGSCSDSVRGQALPPPLSRVPVSRAWARWLCKTEGLCPHPPWQQSRVQVDPEDDGEGEGEGREVADLV